MCIFIWVSYVHRWMECLSFLWAIPDVMSTYIYIYYIYTHYSLCLCTCIPFPNSLVAHRSSHIFLVLATRPNQIHMVPYYRFWLRWAIPMKTCTRTQRWSTRKAHWTPALRQGIETRPCQVDVHTKSGMGSHQVFTHMRTRTHTHPPYKHEEI